MLILLAYLICLAGSQTFEVLVLRIVLKCLDLGTFSVRVKRNLVWLLFRRSLANQNMFICVRKKLLHQLGFI